MPLKYFRFTLNYNASPLILTYNPEEWTELGLKIARHKRYKAVWTSFSTQKLTFKRHDDGAGYIKNAFDTDGFDFEMTILIEWLDMSDFTYKTFFSGVIDSDTYREIDDTGDVEVSIIESSATKKLADREEINYDVLATETADGGIPKTIANIPQIIYLRRSERFKDAKVFGFTFDQDTTEGNNFAYVDVDGDVNAFSSDDLNLPQSTELLYTNNSSQAAEITFSGDFSPNPNFVYTQTEESFQWDYSIEYKLGSAGSWTNLYNDSGTGINISGNQITVNLNAQTGLIFTISVPVSDTLLFRSNFFLDGDIDSDYVIRSVNFPFNNIKITEKQSNPSVNKSGVLLYEAFAKTIDTITEKSIYSEVLGRTNSSPDTYPSNGEYSEYSLQTGYMIRGFDMTDKPFAVNFKDFWQSLMSVFALAMQYNSTLGRFEIIKEIDSFDDTNQITLLDNVKDLEIYPAKEVLFNNIKAGYKEKPEYEELDGASEYNVPAEFETPINAIKNTLDIQSTYSSDGLGITFASILGIDTEGKKDSKYDNLIYFMGLRVDTWEGGSPRPGTDFDEDFSSVSGVPGSDTRMNLKITPKRNMLRHSTITTPLYKKPGTATVNFRKSQTSVPLSTQLTTESSPVVELADELKSDLISSKVEPIFYKFEYPITPSLLADIQANKNGYFAFPNRDGDLLYGYIWDITMDNYTRNSEFILIKKA